MLDPRTIWVALGLVVAGYLAYEAISPRQPAPSEAFAYLRTKNGTSTQVTRIDQAACRARDNRLWTEADGDAQCLAYIAADPLPASDTGIVFFHGDFPQARLSAEKMAASRHNYQISANRLAQAFSVPVFVMARPGVMGSTGFHVIGGVRQEHALVSKAIDELKQRHSLRRIVLVGQSGGARLTAQLLASGRDDIACAVMASGAYGIPGRKGGGEMPTNIWGNPSRSYLMPLRNVEHVVADSRRRLYVIGDRRDRRTPFDGQRKWAEALERAGHRVVLLNANAGGKDHHYLSALAMTLTGMCSAGNDDRAIRNYVHDR